MMCMCVYLCMCVYVFMCLYVWVCMCVWSLLSPKYQEIFRSLSDLICAEMKKIEKNEKNEKMF